MAHWTLSLRFCSAQVKYGQCWLTNSAPWWERQGQVKGQATWSPETGQRVVSQGAIYSLWPPPAVLQKLS